MRVSFRRFSERATTLASASDVRRTLVSVFADDTKQTEKRNYFFELQSTLQQRVKGPAA